MQGSTPLGLEICLEKLEYGGEGSVIKRYF